MFKSSSIAGWREYSKRYTLEGSQCIACQKIYFPSIFLCSCTSKTFKSFKLSGLGKLISFTNITSACAEFKHLPTYCVGLVEFDEGPRATVQLTDVNLSDLYVGMRVQSTFRKFYSHGNNGIIEYGLKFEPILTKRQIKIS